MPSRPNITSRSNNYQRTHTHPTASTPIISRTSSGARTPRTSSRGDLPIRDTNSSRHPPSHYMKEGIQPTTPTPKRPGRRRRPHGKHAVQRRGEDEGADGPEGVERSSEDDEALFDLLGVRSPPSQPAQQTEGVLAVSKALIEGSKRTGTRRRGGGADSEPERSRSLQGEAVRVKGKKGKGQREALSEGEILQKVIDGPRGKTTRLKEALAVPTNAPTPLGQPQRSNLTASRPRSSKPPSMAQKILEQPTVSRSEPPDLASLSKSLPSVASMCAAPQQRAEAKARWKGVEEDEGSVWEMPELSGPVSSQELTWQQKLVSSGDADTSRRSTKSVPAPATDRKKLHPRPTTSNQNSHLAHPPVSSSPLNPRPAHNRRGSLDAVPLSHFDATIPFHTGFNVHRAPQTPVKLSTSQAAGSTLPTLSGEFSRMKHNSKGPLAAVDAGTLSSSPGGTKYAGPTFHNSPHAASLPKPDLGDF